MFFEVSQGGERAILCSVTLREPWYVPDHEEFRSLAESAARWLLLRCGRNVIDRVLRILWVPEG